MANAAGWQRDPEHGDQERYWSGSAWTDRVRPTGRGGSSRVPEHGPQLHRALAAATTDIDAVEDRLSTLFERSDGDLKPARLHRRPGILRNPSQMTTRSLTSPSTTSPMPRSPNSTQPSRPRNPTSPSRLGARCSAAAPDG